MGLIMATHDRPESNISPLFEVLPPELRLLVYEEIFEGSKASYKRKHTVKGRTQLSVLVPSYHCNFLLTCNQAYDEAIKTYWSKTTLYGDPEDVELTFFLGSIVPNFAKLHVRHIRGLNPHELDERPGVDSCLKQYRRLRTVGFKEQWIFNKPYMRTHGSPPSMEDEEWVKLHCNLQSRLKFSKLVLDGGPAVICGSVFRLILLEGNTVGRYEEERKVGNIPNSCCHSPHLTIYSSDDSTIGLLL
jgi:hypothetical protein